LSYNLWILISWNWVVDKLLDVYAILVHTLFILDAHGYQENDAKKST